MKTPFYMGILAAAALLGCAPETPGSRAAHERHEKMEELGDVFKTLSDEAKKDKPDAAVMSENATKVGELAESLPGWFPAGSGPQDGVKTLAKADVWLNELEFADKVREFQQQASELKTASADGVDAMIAQTNDVGQTCKACHQKFREKKD
jgi:cytochrome c556